MGERKHLDQTWTEGLLMGLDEDQRKFVLQYFKSSTTDEQEATDELEKYILDCPWDRPQPVKPAAKPASLLSAKPVVQSSMLASGAKARSAVSPVALKNPAAPKRPLGFVASAGGAEPPTKVARVTPKGVTSLVRPPSLQSAK